MKIEFIENFMEKYGLSLKEFTFSINDLKKTILIDVPNRLVSNCSPIRKSNNLEFNTADISNSSYMIPRPDEFFEVVENDFEWVCVKIRPKLYAKVWKNMIYETGI